MTSHAEALRTWLARRWQEMPRALDDAGLAPFAKPLFHPQLLGPKVRGVRLSTPNESTEVFG